MSGQEGALPLPIDGTVEDVPYEDVSDDDTTATQAQPQTQTQAQPQTQATVPDLQPPAPPATTTEQPAPQPAAPPAPKKRRVRKWSSVGSASFANTLSRQDDVFVAPLDAPLYILSPTMRLQTALFDEEDELCDYATFKMKSTHLAAFQGMEDLLLDMAKSNKQTWFGNDDITDAFLESSLKRFVDPATKTVTVKVHEGLSGRTNASPGTRVKVVLACDQAIFTRTQFGVPWTMHVIRSIENEESMYLFDAEEDASYATVSNDLLAHLTTDRSDDSILADAM